MRLSLAFAVCLFILSPLVLCKNHRSLRRHKSHGRHGAINSQLHYKNDSFVRKKRSDLFSIPDSTKIVKLIAAVDIHNSTSPVIEKSNYKLQPSVELANIFGITEIISTAKNISKLLDNDSFQSHIRIKRDNPDFNEVLDPLPEEPIELHPTKFIATNAKPFANDDISIAKNNFDDVYPESGGLIDYDTPLTRVVKTKREAKKDYPSVVQKSTEEGKRVREKRKKISNNVGDFNDVHEDELTTRKLSLKTIQTRSIQEAKELAAKLVIKVNELEGLMDGMVFNTTGKVNQAPRTERLENTSARNSKNNRIRNVKRFHRRGRQRTHRRKRKSHRKWDRWTDWSSCSVTCGKGRQIRWRHCIRDCTTAETEMEEKTCQLPACAPGKFLGIF